MLRLNVRMFRMIDKFLLPEKCSKNNDKIHECKLYAHTNALRYSFCAYLK